MSDDTATTTALPAGLQQTTDYSIFKIIKGNRETSSTHINYLAEKIKREGNLTQYFPIVVNEYMEVIDGQHRLAALEKLGYPVFYEVKPGLNVNQVISLNTGIRNWGWKDFARSFAERGNENYRQLLELDDEFHERFSTYLLYTGFSNAKSGKAALSSGYYDGKFAVPDFGLTRKLLKQYQDIKQIVGVGSRELSVAAYRFMRTPTYNHEEMLRKLRAYGGNDFDRCYTVTDYMIALDKVWKAS